MTGHKQSSSRGQSFVRDTIYSAGSSALTSASRLLVTIILVRALSPDTYGQFVFDQWLLDFLFMLLSIGMPGVAGRYLASAPERWLFGISPVRLIAGASALSWIMCLIGFSIYQLHTHAQPPSLFCLLFFAIAYLANSFLTPALQGLLRFRAVLLGNLTFAVVAPALCLLVVRWPALATTAVALGAAFGMSAAVATWRAVRSPPLTRPRASVDFRGVATYALNVWIIGLVANLVWSRGEIAILKAHVGNAQLAKYAAAMSLVGLVNQAAGLFTGAVAPYVARHIQLGETVETSRLLRLVTVSTLLVTGIASLFLITLGGSVVPILLGRRYTESGAILAVLSVSAVAITSGAANTTLQIDTNGRFGLIANLIGFATLGGVSFGLVPQLGVMGAAYGRVAAQSLIGLITFWSLHRVPGQQAVSRDLLRAFVLTLGIVVISAASLRITPSLAGRLALFSILAPALVGSCLWSTRLRLSGAEIRKLFAEPRPK